MCIEATNSQPENVIADRKKEGGKKAYIETGIVLAMAEEKTAREMRH